MAFRDLTRAAWLPFQAATTPARRPPGSLPQLPSGPPPSPAGQSASASSFRPSGLSGSSGGRHGKGLGTRVREAFVRFFAAEGTWGDPPPGSWCIHVARQRLAACVPPVSVILIACRVLNDGLHHARSRACIGVGSSSLASACRPFRTSPGAVTLDQCRLLFSVWVVSRIPFGLVQFRGCSWNLSRTVDFTRFSARDGLIPFRRPWHVSLSDETLGLGLIAIQMHVGGSAQKFSRTENFRDRFAQTFPGCPELVSSSFVGAQTGTDQLSRGDRSSRIASMRASAARLSWT